MAITTTETAGAREWIARPNRSLTPTARRGLIGLILSATALVCGGFVLAGAWLVLPFAGLELAVLFIALRAIERGDRAYESIRLDGQALIVDSHLPGQTEHQSFHAGWAKVSLEDDSSGEPLLCIRSHGRSARIGRLMTLSQRQQLALDLKHHLQP